MEIELVEVIIFENEWKALSKVSTSPMDLLAVVQQILDLVLVLQLIMSHVVPFQEFLHRFRIVLANLGISLTRLLNCIVIEQNQHILGLPTRTLSMPFVHESQRNRDRGLIIHWERHYIALIAITTFCPHIGIHILLLLVHFIPWRQLGHYVFLDVFSARLRIFGLFQPMQILLYPLVHRIAGTSFFVEFGFHRSA